MKFVFLEPAPLVTAVGVWTVLGEGVDVLLQDAADRIAPHALVPLDLPLACAESPLRFRRMDRYAALGFVATGLALSRGSASALDTPDPAGGVILGSSLGCGASNADYFQELLLKETPAELSPALFARTISNSVNGEISIAHHIGGANMTLVSGWTAGAEALVEAATHIAEGKSRWIVAGGVEAPNETLARLHAQRRAESGMEWVPQTLAEGAAVCLMSASEERRAQDLGLCAYWRGHDPQGEISLGQALSALRPRVVDQVIVANAVAPELWGCWRSEIEPVRLTRLPGGVGEIGAAGGPLAVALAARGCAGQRPRTVDLVVARDIEGMTVLIAVES